MTKMNPGFATLYATAHAAGHAAATVNVPTPMTIYGGEPGGPVKVWHESEGACGFAWIRFRGDTAWGHWAKKAGKAKPHYPRGLRIWVSDYNQSVARKEAYAEAFAKVLTEAGIEAFAESRLD